MFRLSVGLLAGAVVDLRGSDGLGPVMSPVEVVGVPRVRVLPAQNHAVDEASHQRYEPEDEEHYTQDPETYNDGIKTVISGKIP